MSKVHQSRVVPDVGMGDEDGIDGLACPARDTRLLMQQGQLAVDSGRRLDEHEPIGLAVMDSDARRRLDTPASSRLGAAVLFPPSVGQASILGSPQDIGGEACALDVDGWRRTRRCTAW